MALELSAKAAIYSKGTNVRQQLILEIDGIDTVFGAVEVLKVARVGDDGLIIGDSWVIGGNVPTPDQKDYISINRTSKSITQQLRQDKGAASSVSKITIEMIDKNDELSALFVPGAVIDDILSAKAKVYIGFAQGAHPEDSIEIFSGIIDNAEFASGTVLLSIAHPEQLKRQEIFPQISSVLSSSVDNSVTTIPLDSNANMVEPNGFGVNTYVRIDDELIEYTGLGTDTLTGCVRGSLGTSASAHDIDADVVSFYKLAGGAIDLALQLMMSGSGVYVENVDVSNIVRIKDGTIIPNSISYPGIDVKSKYGVVLGDFISVSGASNSENNFTNRTIVEFGTNDSGSYIVVDGADLVAELETNAVSSFSSQYDVLPVGCGLGLAPDQVDVQEHLEVQTLYSSGFHTYDLYIDDSVVGKTFIEEQIYFPSGLYSLPRKGRSSVGSTNPPLAGETSKTIGINEVIDPSKIQIGRGINKNFYNSIIYKYEKAPLEDKYLRGVVTLSSTSTNRIKVGNRPLTIKSNGIRTGSEPIINIQSRKFLDRYKFGAESLSFSVMYSSGFDVEVGDVVIFGDDALKMTDISTGTRNFAPRLMEVSNKDFNVVSGNIKLSLIDTAFDIDGRFVSIAPASKLDSGSTIDTLQLKKEFTLKGLERAKWTQYLGQNVVVRNEDFTVLGETTLIDFDPIDNTKINISPELAFAPGADYIVEPPAYQGDADTNKFWKSIHASLTPEVNIVSGTSSTVFDVDSIDNLFVGASIVVNSDDFTDLSEGVKIDSIIGTTITVDSDLGFTPTSGYKVNEIGFVSDSGGAYLIT